MGRDISLDEVVEHFTLDGGDLELIRDKAGRLGFSVMLKYLMWPGRSACPPVTWASTT